MYRQLIPIEYLLIDTHFVLRFVWQLYSWKQRRSIWKFVFLDNYEHHHLLAPQSRPLPLLFTLIQVVIRPLPAEGAVSVPIFRFPLIVVGSSVLLHEGARSAFDQGVAETGGVEMETGVGRFSDLAKVLPGVTVWSLVCRFWTVQPLWNVRNKFGVCVR